MTLAVTDPVSATAAATADSIGVTFSATPTDGEVILLVLLGGSFGASDCSDNFGTAPSGFSLGYGYQATTEELGRARYIRYFSKVASSESGATYTFTSFSTGSDGAHKILIGMRLTGYTGTPTFEDTDGSDSQTTTDAMATGTVTPTSANSIIVAAVCTNNGTACTFGSWTNSFTEKTDDNETTGLDFSGASAIKVLTAATSATTGCTASGTQTSQVGAIIALSDVGGGGGAGASATGPGGVYNGYGIYRVHGGFG